MVGGLFTSAFLTLEIIPVVYAYWRYGQLKREQSAGAKAAPTGGGSKTHEPFEERE